MINLKMPAQVMTSLLFVACFVPAQPAAVQSRFSSKNHEEFLVPGRAYPDLFFPTPEVAEGDTKVSVLRVPLSAFSVNARQNLETSVQFNERAVTIELSDDKNPVGFTTLRYENMFYHLATALGIPCEIPQLAYINVASKESPDVRFGIVRSREGLSSLTTPVSTQLNSQLKLLEKLTGVKIATQGDVLVKNGSDATTSIILRIATPDRILAGLTSPYEAPTESQVAEMSGLLKANSSTLSKFFTRVALRDLTKLEMSDLSDRMTSLMKR